MIQRALINDDVPLLATVIALVAACFLLPWLLILKAVAWIKNLPGPA